MQILILLSPISKWLKTHSLIYRNIHAYLYATKDIIRRKESYSQWGDDKKIFDYFLRLPCKNDWTKKVKV
jgi:hypothetical protein